MVPCKPPLHSVPINLDDALLLPAFDQAVSINNSQDDHSHRLGTLELKFPLLR